MQAFAEDMKERARARRQHDVRIGFARASEMREELAFALRCVTRERRHLRSFARELEAATGALVERHADRLRELPQLEHHEGRVIIEGDGPDTNFIGGSEEEAMRAPAMRGALDSLTRLTRHFERRVWLVSKCGKKVEGRSPAWLDKQHFFERTSIPRANLRFCKDRRAKTPICQELGIDVFIDDRLDVLLPMAGIVPHRILFGATESPSPGVHAARTWEIAEELIMALLQVRDTPAAHAL